MQKTNDLLQSEREMTAKIMKENFELQSKIRSLEVHHAQQQVGLRPKRHEVFSIHSIDDNKSRLCSTKDCIVIEDIKDNAVVTEVLQKRSQNQNKANKHNDANTNNGARPKQQPSKTVENTNQKKEKNNKQAAQSKRGSKNKETKTNSQNEVAAESTSSTSSIAFSTSNTAASTSKKDNFANESKDPDIWTKNTVLVIGDSMISNINEKTLSRKYHMKVRSFPGANTRDLQDYVKPLIRKRPDKIIIVIGTNDIERKTVNEILRNIKLVMDMILERLPDCHIVISEIIRRADTRLSDGDLQKLNGKISKFNQDLKKMNVDILRQQNIIKEHLGRYGLHLNFSGNKQLALNIIEKLRSFKD